MISFSSDEFYEFFDELLELNKYENDFGDVVCCFLKYVDFTENLMKSRMLDWACKNGYVNLSEKMHNLMDEEEDNKHYYEGNFVDACRNGHLETVKQIYEKCNKKSIELNVESGFGDACREGHYNIVIQLYEWNPNINITESYFVDACLSGSTRTVKQLYYWNPNIKLDYDKYKCLLGAQTDVPAFLSRKELWINYRRESPYD